MRKLLDGIRVLAISQFGAGPFGSMHLADLGAEVIKIENRKTGGDVARNVPPYAIPGDSLYFQSLNRNKRSITIDLKHFDGQRVFRDLVRFSDAVFSNLRGDLPVVLGLTYEQLRSVNPRIVCCSLTGFGTTGPRHAEPAYDYLIQALAGWMSLTGDPGALPAKSGLSLVDFSAGVVAMVGLLSGLLDAQRTGRGCDIDVSLLDTAISMLNYVAIWTLNRGYQPQRLADSAHPTMVPAQVFQTRDGHILVLCFKEKFWRALTEVLGAPQLANDPRYASFASRYEHRDDLIAVLKDRLLARTTEEWLARLAGKVPCSPVNSVEEALREEQVLARDMLVEVQHPAFGNLKQVRTAIKVQEGAAEARSASTLGADTSRRSHMTLRGHAGEDHTNPSWRRRPLLDRSHQLC
jgi:crotonobetainyl-CoA:carnitine CoA-transferase CaiB-like acyl-CoA transferase